MSPKGQDFSVTALHACKGDMRVSDLVRQVVAYTACLECAPCKFASLVFAASTGCLLISKSFSLASRASLTPVLDLSLVVAF